ncbi:hypothetical protein ACQKCJ_24365, partial [Flavobacterium sp. NPDC079362]|uniref:hypothetical protein n=1 Tax=Flavobacterium sp. NPDC079362 TaxID=3390566 RepID=UPI003D02FA81
FRFQVSGFRFQVSGFRFQVSGFRFQVSGFRFLTFVKVFNFDKGLNSGIQIIIKYWHRILCIYCNPVLHQTVETVRYIYSNQNNNY